MSKEQQICPILVRRAEQLWTTKASDAQMTGHGKQCRQVPQRFAAWPFLTLNFPRSHSTNHDLSCAVQRTGFRSCQHEGIHTLVQTRWNQLQLIQHDATALACSGLRRICFQMLQKTLAMSCPDGLRSWRRPLLVSAQEQVLGAWSRTFVSARYKLNSTFAKYADPTAIW